MNSLILIFVLLTSFIFGQGTDKTRQKLGVLAFSGYEVQNIAEYLSGDVFIDKQMTKREFLKKVKEYDIIHLATHTFIDKKNPLQSRFYVLNNSKLSEDSSAIFSSDILSLNLKAKMAVLSACNTGVGELVEGEGIMSLARDFQFAGVPSIIMTLWEINDISTSNIMNSFYSKLGNGLKKDVALRAAKLEYLSNSNSKNSAPVFWAASVPVGEMESLTFNKFTYNWIYLFVLPLFILFWFVYRSFRKSNLSRALEY